jgi:hypothetical protein
MGCDIHGHIERRTANGWEYLPDAYFPDGRNYNVFAILADVRNGHGFAGIKTGEGFNFIAEPRGLPNDMSPELQRIAKGETSEDDYRWLGDHSRSWLTLRELFEFDYLQETQIQGYITLEQYAKLEHERARYNPRWNREYPCPQSWSGDISGGGIYKMDEAEARNRIATIKEHHPEAFTQWGMPSERFKEFVKEPDARAVATMGTGLYVLAKWPRRYLDSMSGFLLELVPLIKYGLDDVRLVFGFDS